MKEETKKNIMAYLKRYITYVIVIILANISWKLVTYKGVGLYVGLEEMNFLNVILALVGVIGVIGTFYFFVRELTIMTEEKKKKKKEQNHDR
ncbi:hypothetical protein K0040_02145 [Terrisporobacter petrolearius]|uniref:hypothetical protein n=1 Tax=Terrisporobacter petrolearius TaxID=1460447 RepID=UPI001D16A9C6|nr:hypothetical protein [Terrisporobacter petrolearius]MCC3863116.1 hypothetical protein [Terrisporobacter petrolearius]